MEVPEDVVADVKVEAEEDRAIEDAGASKSTVYLLGYKYYRYSWSTHRVGYRCAKHKLKDGACKGKIAFTIEHMGFIATYPHMYTNTQRLFTD